jgi:glycosyltransferase involved in cell wall biosynthesis
MLADITPVILTFNEAENIGRALERLDWARRIVVVDSFSTDETLDILRRHPQVEIFQRRFDTHTEQWNFGVAQARSEWVLSLDADYILPPEFARELETLPPDADVDAWYARFKYCVFDRPLRAALLPPRAVLFRKSKCTYFQDGHTQLLRIDGRSATLCSCIHHDDRKPLARWLWAQDRYAALEADKLLGTPWRKLGTQDRIRRCIIFAPLFVFVYTLLGKGVVLDGLHGWFYAYQRTLAEILLSAHVIGRKLGSR